MNYFNDPKYFGIEIVFGGLGKFHFLFADTHVLSDTKPGCRDSNTQSPGFHPAPYCEDVDVGHSRQRHTSCRMDCVIISLDKFQQNVYKTMWIRECKIFESSITDCPVKTFYARTFYVGISQIPETECPRHVACPENVYLETLYPCRYVPTRGGVNHHEIGIEKQLWLQGRSSSLWEPDVDVSRKHRLQIECICTYHCILREIACLIYRTRKPAWGWSRCRDYLRTFFWQAYALYRRLDITTMLWHQNWFQSYFCGHFI
jgi:hypothetical protein